MEGQFKIRVDAGEGIGLGHLIRCLTVAGILRDNGKRVIFFMRRSAENLTALVTEKKFPVTLIDDNGSFLRHLEADDAVVLDGYQYDSAYELQIRERVKKVITIDDLANRHFYADVIINHTPGTHADLYDAEPYTKIFTGLAYCLLRDEVLQAPRRTSPPAQNLRCMICLGGEDPENIVMSVLSKVKKETPAVAIDVVVGAAYKHRQELETYAKSLKDVTVFVNLPVNKLLDVIAAADVAVVSPSTISLECIYLGIPLYLYKTAPNQSQNFDYLIRNKMALPFDRYGTLSADETQLMMQLQSRAFPGNIRSNIAHALNS